MIERDIERVLTSKEEILAESIEPGKQSTEEYQGKNPLVVGILKGAVPFMTDLTREINTYLESDLMGVSSYGNVTVSSGEVKIVKGLDTNVEGRHILIVGDIIDNGHTLTYLIDLLRYRKVASVKVVTLLDKPEGRVADVKVDYVGLDMPNELVVGYGLDYVETYRNLSYTGILKSEVYKSDRYPSRN